MSEQEKQPPSASPEEREPPAESTSLALRVLDVITPDPESCRQAAAKLAADFPGMTKEQRAAHATKRAKQVCAAVGGGMGLFSSPLSAIPAAAADVTVTLKTEAYLAGVIAAILDPDSLNDPTTFRADIFAILFPSAATQALREVAMKAGQATTKTLIRRYISKDVLKALIKFAAKYLGIKLTQRAILTKAIPLVGSVIGAGWNWVEVQRVGKRAVEYYSDQSVFRVPGEE